MKDKKTDEDAAFAALSPLEKGAIILNTLGVADTKLIFKNLKDSDVKKMIEMMGAIKKVPISLAKRVLKEFYDALSENKEYLFPGLNGWSKEGGPQSGPASAPSLDALELVDNKTLTNFLLREHPQTVALIFAHLSPLRKSEIFKNLPEKLQTEVILRINQMDLVSPSHLAQLNELLSRELVPQAGSKAGPLGGGAAEMAAVLNKMDKKSQQILLERLQSEDPEMSEKIRKSMLVFEDLVYLDDHGWKLLMKEVDLSQWPLALKLCSGQLKAQVLKNLSGRAAKILEEDLAALGPTKKSQVEKRQQEILEKFKDLEAQGKISLHQGDGQGSDPLV